MAPSSPPSPDPRVHIDAHVRSRRHHGIATLPPYGRLRRSRNREKPREDGDQYVIYLDDENQAFAFAKNRIAFDGGFQEFTGAAFSRDGRFVFVNTQQPGITYAIKGPWRNGNAH